MELSENIKKNLGEFSNSTINAFSMLNYPNNLSLKMHEKLNEKLDEQGRFYLGCIDEDHQLETFYAFVDGIERGKKDSDIPIYRFEENLKTNDLILSKDIMIMYAFYDNDFGACFEEASKYIVKEVQNIFFNLALGHEANNGYFLEKFDKLLDKKNIVQILKNGFFSSYVKYMIESGITESDTIDNVVKRGKELLDNYFEINEDSIKIGTVDEITKEVIENNKGYQLEGHGTTLENTWLNGEVLFIKIKDGECKSFVQ